MRKRKQVSPNVVLISTPPRMVTIVGATLTDLVFFEIKTEFDKQIFDCLKKRITKIEKYKSKQIFLPCFLIGLSTSFYILITLILVIIVI